MSKITINGENRDNQVKSSRPTLQSLKTGETFRFIRSDYNTVYIMAEGRDVDGDLETLNECGLDYSYLSLQSGLVYSSDDGRKPIIRVFCDMTTEEED